VRVVSPVPKKKPPKIPRVLKGSVVVHRRRCGKPNCRCADGAALHESTVLSYSEAGKTHFVMLPTDRVEAVRAATARYQEAKEVLEAEAVAGLARLVASLRNAKGSRR
jgi:hypothetical protein